MIEKQPTYSGLNQYTPTDTPLLNDVSAIFQSIDNILSTSPGERLFNPEFGSNIEDYLFEPLDEDTAMRIENEVIRAIGRWEPRILLVNNLTVATPIPGENRFSLRIVFRLRAIDNQDFEYNINLNRNIES